MTEVLHKAEWEIRTIPLSVAQDFVMRLHYTRGGSNTATYRHGLFRRGSANCRGIAWWIPPTKSAAKATYRTNWGGVLCLSRLVLDPECPKNSASFLLAASRRAIDRLRWPCLVTYADEWQGHTGAIYRADNWEYKGKTSPEPVFQIQGRMVARKAGPRTRTHTEMVALGAILVGRFSKHKFVHIKHEYDL